MWEKENPTKPPPPSTPPQKKKKKKINPSNMLLFSPSQQFWKIFSSINNDQFDWHVQWKQSNDNIFLASLSKTDVYTEDWICIHFLH